MIKNALNTFFLKLLFFPLSSFSLLPKHSPIIFSGKLTTKNGQKSSLKEKKNLFIIYFTFYLSPYGKKQNHLLFPPFLSREIGKRQGKTLQKKFFFLLFFFYFFAPYRSSYLKKYQLLVFFRYSDLKCPKLPHRVRKFHLFQITFFPP